MNGSLIQPHALLCLQHSCTGTNYRDIKFPLGTIISFVIYSNTVHSTVFHCLCMYLLYVTMVKKLEINKN